MSDTEKSLESGRPENATALPNFSGQITDMRITTVPRDIDISSDSASDFGVDLSRLEYMQVYYGYNANGTWHDIPCENYDLKSIFNSRDYETLEPILHEGYAAADLDHIVKIGPYLLISIRAACGTGAYYEVYDSIDSEILLLFTEYDNIKNESSKKYGYLKENRESVVSGWQLEFHAFSSFDARYYVILEYDSLPKDYQLWTIEHSADMNIKRTLTYSDIQAFLEE